MKKIVITSLFLILLQLGCQQNTKQTITLKNSLDKNREDELVSISLNKIKSVSVEKLAAYSGEIELPSQLVDSDGDGKKDRFAFLITINPNETKQITLIETEQKQEFTQRAHAEISEKVDYELVDGVYEGGHFESVHKSTTPIGHIDHNYFYKCEGPAWESDKVGYRLYLDWRNSTDIFGKKVSDIILPNVGHTKDASGQDNYHNMADWGMDVLKVGTSLGIGTFGAWIDEKVEKVSKTESTTCTVLEDGPISALLNIKYSNWEFGKGKADLNSNVQIDAGSRLTHYSFKVGNNHDEYCTGLAKHANTEYLASDPQINDEWNYIAIWGKQSLAGEDDDLGIALFYNKSSLVKITDDEFSEIVVLKAQQNKLDYYFAACWSQESDGIKNKEEFITYLNEVIGLLDNPLQVVIQ